MFKHQRPNRVTGILYHADLWNIAGFIPEKQVLAKISIEPIKEASCLTEMWTGLYPVLTRLRLTVTGSSSVRMIPKSIISAGEYRPGTEK